MTGIQTDVPVTACDSVKTQQASEHVCRCYQDTVLGHGKCANKHIYTMLGQGRHSNRRVHISMWQCGNTNWMRTGETSQSRYGFQTQHTCKQMCTVPKWKALGHIRCANRHAQLYYAVALGNGRCTNSWIHAATWWYLDLLQLQTVVTVALCLHVVALVHGHANRWVTAAKSRLWDTARVQRGIP